MELKEAVNVSLFPLTQVILMPEKKLFCVAEYVFIVKGTLLQVCSHIKVQTHLNYKLLKNGIHLLNLEFYGSISVRGMMRET